MPSPQSSIDFNEKFLSADNRVAEGQKLQQHGRHEDALRIAEEVLSEFPDFASAQLLRGAACRSLHRHEEAAEAFRNILEQFPDFDQMRLNLANACIELGDLPEAEIQLTGLIDRNPQMAQAHATLGSLYMRLDRYDLAEAPTRRALALDSSIIVAHQNLAAILALRDDMEADVHRDAAYHRQQIFLEPSPGAPRTALILVASGSGNVPYQHLLPRRRYNRIVWHIGYAPPGQEKELPPHDIVFNAVGDPDAAGTAQIAVERFAMHCAHPLLNRPDSVARTLRSQMPALLDGISNVVVPQTHRFTRTGGDLVNSIAASGLGLPLILRPAGRHGGEGAKLVLSKDKLSASLPDCDAIYATEFCDYRSRDGWFRKYRMIFIDDEPYPYHLAIGSHWLLHYRTADMQTGPSNRRAEEAEFLRDPGRVLGGPAIHTLRNIAARLDLDYAGIDFSLLPDGRLLFFEANATMLVHPEDDPLFAYKNDAVAAIITAMDMMIARRLGQ